jgi:hypothetical protein
MYFHTHAVFTARAPTAISQPACSQQQPASSSCSCMLLTLRTALSFLRFVSSQCSEQALIDLSDHEPAYFFGQ